MVKPWPVAVSHESVRLRMIDGSKPKEATHLAFEVAGRNGHGGEGWNPGIVARDVNDEFADLARRVVSKGIDNPQLFSVVMAGNHGEAVPSGQKLGRVIFEGFSRDALRFQRRTSVQRKRVHQWIAPSVAAARARTAAIGWARNAITAVVTRARTSGSRGP